MKLQSILSGVLMAALALARPVLAEQTPPTGAGATTSATNTGAAEIQFETPIFEFGRVQVGDPVKHDYVFTNTGNATLVISKVEPKCGCTITSAWTKEVEPGKTGIIPIQFNSTGYGGAVTKFVGVSCNAKTTPEVMLQLKGTVFKTIEVTPTTAVLTVFSDSDSNAVAVVHITNNLAAPITLSEPQSSNAGLEATLKTLQPGREF